MLYIKIGNIYLHTYHTWSEYIGNTWNNLSSFSWKDIFTNNSESEIYPLANNISILDLINDQSTCDLKIYDKTLTANFKKGQSVLIYDDNHELIFSGFIDSVIKQHSGSQNLLHMIYDISCIDNHYLVNKRKMIKAFVNETVSNAVAWIQKNILRAEGVSIGVIAASTKIINKSYNYISVREVLDELAEYAGYIWFIDCNKRLYFIPLNLYKTPFDIVLDDNCKCEHIRNDSFTVSDANPEYRNTEIMTGSTNKSVLQTKSFKGDGECQTWTVNLPIAEKPVVKVNGVAKTVGINAVNTEYDFYWNEGEPFINQDSSATKLTAAQTLTVEYIGFYNIVVKTANFEEIADKAVLEGTTGIVEDVVSDTSYKTKVDAIDRANILVETYGIDSKTISYTTSIEGIEAGQLQHIYSVVYGLDHDCIISQVTKTDNEYELEYQVIAVAGPINDYWTKQMMLASNAKTKALADSLETSSVLLILLTYDKTWTSIESPNIFYPIYPSNSLLPGSAHFPCFDTNQLCSYIEFNISGGYRIYMTDQTITETQVITTFIIPSQDCNGNFTNIKLYGGALATATIGSGVLLSTHSIIYTKNSLESFQIVITYNKWS